MGEQATPEKRNAGRRIKAARAAAELEQADVARALGTHRVTVSRWERGASAVPTEDRAKLAKVLKATEAQLWPEDAPAISRETLLVREAPATPYGRGVPHGAAESLDYYRGLLDAALSHNASVSTLVRTVRDALATSTGGGRR